ncbi:MAG TPA: hypothetical protein PL124_10710 [Candidatus Cloacimonadota bacterium]|nr:hypothetical protein [Candidatus Cloacimonadota bacterium]
MNYAKQFEPIERKTFEVKHWDHLFNTAKVYRNTCKWDEQAENGIKIRKNDLPLRPLQAAPNWQGKFYVDNWLWKSIKWLVSMQTGAQIDVDLHGYDGVADKAQDLLELEIAYALEQFDFFSTMEMCQYDRYYTGMGVARAIWNTRDVQHNYMTGTPRLDYVSPMNVYLDPATRKPDFSDCRYLFHEEYYDLAEMKRRNPRYASKLVECIDEARPDATGLMRAITVQYKKTVTLTKVYLEDQDSGASEVFLASEWEKYCAEMAQTPGVAERYLEEQPEASFEEWIAEGGFLPEKVVMLGPVEADETAVFQAIYVPELDLILEAPQYVGKDYTYFFLSCYNEPDSAYPVGLAKYMSGALEASIALMTILMITAAKTYRAKEMIQEGSLVNQDEYMEKGYELGIQPVVREDWQRRNPNSKAIEPVKTPDFPVALSMLNDQLVNIQKTMSGAIDANMGMAQFSGQSGVQVAQLQMASRVYQKEDIEGFRRFIKGVCEWLKGGIATFRNYPHKIQGLNDLNQTDVVNVADAPATKFNAERYYIEVTILDNQEVVKQMEREVVMQLFKMGLYSDIDLLRKMDIPNPEKIIENAQVYHGEKQYLDVLKANPQAKAIMDQFIAQAMQPQQVQQAQNAVSA